jgi:hypothetical protein
MGWSETVSGDDVPGAGMMHSTVRKNAYADLQPLLQKCRRVKRGNVDQKTAPDIS